MTVALVLEPVDPVVNRQAKPPGLNFNPKSCRNTAQVRRIVSPKHILTVSEVVRHAQNHKRPRVAAGFWLTPCHPRRISQVKAYPTQDVMGLLFRITQGQAQRAVAQIDGGGRAIDSAASPRSTGAKKVAERARLRLPQRIHTEAEAGAAGVVTPWTQRNGGALHWRHRRFNRLPATHRIAVEYTLPSVKRLRSLRDEFRNRRTGTSIRLGSRCIVRHHIEIT